MHGNWALMLTRALERIPGFILAKGLVSGDTHKVDAIRDKVLAVGGDNGCTII